MNPDENRRLGRAVQWLGAEQRGVLIDAALKFDKIADFPDDALEAIAEGECRWDMDKVKLILAGRA